MAYFKAGETYRHKFSHRQDPEQPWRWISEKDTRPLADRPGIKVLRTYKLPTKFGYMAWWCEFEHLNYGEMTGQVRNDQPVKDGLVHETCGKSVNSCKC